MYVQMSEEMEDELLHKTQTEISMRLLPVIVSAAVLVVIGIFGNILAIAFYAKPPKPSVPLILVKHLAVADLATCFAAIPIISEMVINVRYSQGVVCKLTHFTGNWSISASCFLLWIISIDRYRKICKPFSKQITLSAVKYILLASIAIPLSLSVRLLATFDINEVNLTAADENKTLKGYFCAAQGDGVYRNLGIAFYGVDFILILIIWVTILVTYSKIIYLVIKRRINTIHSSASLKSSSSNSKRIKTSSKCSFEKDKNSSVKDKALEVSPSQNSDSSKDYRIKSKTNVFTIAENKTERERKNCSLINEDISNVKATGSSELSSNDNSAQSKGNVFTIAEITTQRKRQKSSFTNAEIPSVENIGSLELSLNTNSANSDSSNDNSAQSKGNVFTIAEITTERKRQKSSFTNAEIPSVENIGSLELSSNNKPANLESSVDNSTESNGNVITIVETMTERKRQDCNFTNDRNLGVKVNGSLELSPRTNSANSDSSNDTSTESDRNVLTIPETTNETERKKSKSSIRRSRISLEISSVRKPIEWNLTLMMFLVSVVYLLCFTPFFIVRVFMRLVFGTSKEYNFSAGIQFALKLPYFNSVFNPIIYCICNVKFRRHIKNVILKCCKCRK